MSLFKQINAGPSYSPPLPSLHAGLECALKGAGISASHLEILNRRRSAETSSFPAEIVTCRLEGGRTLEVLCKYGVGRGRSGYGHRLGVAYETRIYRDILAKVTTRVVPYLGHYEEPGSEAVWLFLEFLGDAPTIHLTTTPFENLIRAARWIGDFHAQTEALLEDAQPGFLNEYDRTYFTGWARRTTEYAGRWHSRHKWLQQACERFEEVSELLLEPAQCIIHGEYYPKNILISNDVICPVDWESAAIAAGEIDLASLTDRWPDEIERRCELAYCDARWNGCAPDQAFRDRLSAARIYLHLRWLGTNVETTTDKERGHRLEQLKRDALQTGLIQ